MRNSFASQGENSPKDSRFVYGVVPAGLATDENGTGDQPLLSVNSRAAKHQMTAFLPAGGSAASAAPPATSSSASEQAVMNDFTGFGLVGMGSPCLSTGFGLVRMGITFSCVLSRRRTLVVYLIERRSTGHRLKPSK